MNFMVLRSTIEELSAYAEWDWYENYLHAVRIGRLLLEMENQEVSEFVKK